jgi:acetyltransferase-like isoleucine patch superfamily enzyme
VTPRELAKACARALATVAVAPALLSYVLKAAVLGPNRALEGSSQTLSLIPGVLGQYLRVAFLRRVLASCDASATVEFGVLFSQAGTRIEANAYIGPRCQIGLAHIKQDVLLGAGVHVPSGAKTHEIADLETPIREQGGTRTMVTIGAGSWIGSNAVVMADIGEGTIVGAGSVVTREVPARVIAAGVPARVIRPRT